MSLDTMRTCNNPNCTDPPYFAGFCRDHDPRLRPEAPPAPPRQPSAPPHQPENVLAEAERLVYGDRAAAYGPADENHTGIMKLFTVWLDIRYPNGFGDLDSFDSCVFNVFQKLSRLAHSLRKDPNKPHRDSIVDGAGYFGVMGKIAEERAAKLAKKT